MHERQAQLLQRWVVDFFYALKRAALVPRPGSIS